MPRSRTSSTSLSTSSFLGILFLERVAQIVGHCFGLRNGIVLRDLTSLQLPAPRRLQAKMFRLLRLRVLHHRYRRESRRNATSMPKRRVRIYAGRLRRIIILLRISCMHGILCLEVVGIIVIRYSGLESIIA